MLSSTVNTSTIVESDVMQYITHQPWKVFINNMLATSPYINSKLQLALQHVQNCRANTSITGVYPSSHTVFAAFNAIPSPSDVRVVILGQDPYHQPNQAMGLSFSVPKGIAIPPSLRNIFREQCEDTELDDINGTPSHGDLSQWARQGVLLLNAALTVEHSSPKSHVQKWKPFTDAVIESLASTESNIVFMLWGGDAKKKKKLISKYISSNGHLILEANHPSPLSANKGGWFGCKHFSKANVYLEKNGYDPINWKLSS